MVATNAPNSWQTKNIARKTFLKERIGLKFDKYKNLRQDLCN